MERVNSHDRYDVPETQPLLGNAPGGINPNLPPTSSRGDVKPKERSVKRVFFKMCFLLLGDYIAAADLTFLLAVYEGIASEMNSSDRAAWLILAESLVYCIFMPLYGFLVDRYGAKIPVLTAYVVFIIGCITVSFAPTFEIIILGRLFSGTAGAGMFSITAIVIADNAKPSEVGILRSYANVFQTIGRNTGPIIGGLLADALGWRKAFLCEIPLAVICFVMVGLLFDPSKPVEDEDDDEDDEHEGRPSKQPEQPKQQKPIDFLGIILLAITVTGYTLLITRLTTEDSRKSPLTIASAVITVVFGIALFFWERSKGDIAFIPLTIFNRALGVLFASQLSWMLGYFALLTIIPKYFTRVENTKASSTALHLLPTTVAFLAGTLSAGQIIRTYKRYKLLMHLSVASGSLGYFLLAFLWNGNINLAKSFIIVLTGFGGGMFNASIFTALNMESQEGKKGATMGFFFLAQEIGIMTGVSGSATMIEIIYEKAVWVNAPMVPHRSEIIRKIFKNASFVFSLSKAWQDAVIPAFLKGFKIFCLTGGAVTVLMQPLMFILKERKLE